MKQFFQVVFNGNVNTCSNENIEEKKKQTTKINKNTQERNKEKLSAQPQQQVGYHDDWNMKDNLENTES